MGEQTLGERLAQVRRRCSLTQEALADRSGVSVDTIFKLEQGRRKGARLSTLHALARGLGVATAELLGPEGSPAEPDDGDPAGLLALRRILIPAFGEVADDGDLLSLDALRTASEAVTRAYHRSHYAEVLSDLPPLLARAITAVSAYQGDQQLAAIRLLAHLYVIAAAVLIQLRREDLAYEAVRRAMDHAEQAGDPILRASGADYLAWILQRQGRFDDAEATVCRMSEAIEPSLTKASPVHLSVWGCLVMKASASAARNNRPDTAHDLLLLARAAATRIERDRMDYDSYWASFGPTTVATLEVENAMTSGDAPRALHLARAVTFTEHMPLSTWSRHRLTVAEAQASTKDYAGSAKTLLLVQDTAPEWLKHQRLGKLIVRDLLDATSVRRAKHLGLAGLASWLGVGV